MVGSLWTILWPAGGSTTQGLYITGAWLLVVVPRVTDAIGRTRTEREQAAAEKAAFDKFAKRIAALDSEGDTVRAKASSYQSSTGPSITAVVDQTEFTTEGATGPVGSIPASVFQEVYRETVMAVPHYEEEYGESFHENFAAELGISLAQTLSESDTVTPQLQAAILDQTQQASSRRSDLLAHTEAEYETLTEARRQLRELYETAVTIEEDLYPRPVRELVQSWDRLEAVATDCQTLLHERQEYLQTDQKYRSMTRRSFQEYLYQPFQWEHPVLNDGLDTIIRIRRAKQNTVEAIYDW